MKKIVLLITFLLLLISCENICYLIPEKELPEWLKTSIKQDEKMIKEHPGSVTSYGSWIRYEWHDEYYYEYHNSISSLLPKPISHIGDTLDFSAADITKDYHWEKCCDKYVWKGPKYEGY